MQQNSGRASLSNYGRRRRCCREEGGARAYGALPPSPAPLYIGALEGGRAQPCPFLQGRGAAKRGGGVHPPQGTSEVPSPLWTLPPPSFLGAWALGAGSPWPKWAKAHPLRPMWPPKQVAPPGGPRDPSGGPGTIPITPKLVPMAETALPIYNSLPPDHSGTPRDVRDLIRDSEQHSGYCTYISLQP